MKERRAALGGALPKRLVRAKPLAQPGDKVYAEFRDGLGQAAGRDDDGDRPAVQGPDEGQGDRLAVRADHPGRGAHLRPGRDLPDGQDLLAARAGVRGRRPRPAAVLQGVDDRADPARGDLRGRLDGVADRGRVVLRHARDADDPVLHLLLDVRLPAHRRPVLAARRPARPRLRPRRDGGTDDAHRRGPAARRRPFAAAGLDQPGVRRLRPGVRLRDRAHRAGRAGADVRRRRLLAARGLASTTSSTT